MVEMASLSIASTVGDMLDIILGWAYVHKDYISGNQGFYSSLSKGARLRHARVNT